MATSTSHPWRSAMARRRWIEHDGRRLTLRGWALEAGIAPGTLWDRLERRHLPMARALATGIVTRAEQGRRGKRAFIGA